MHMNENMNLIFLELLVAIPLVIIVLLFAYRISKKNSTNIEEIVSKVVQENNDSASKHNLEKIDLTLKPFKDQLENLNKDIVSLKQEQAETRGNFNTTMQSLFEITDRASNATRDLTLALSGNVRTQGAWGEQVLEKTLEESGLRKDRDYILQKKFTASDGSTVQPDAIVLMPDKRSIIIDSKVSLTSYIKYVDADKANDEDAKEKNLLHRETPSREKQRQFGSH